METSPQALDPWDLTPQAPDLLGAAVAPFQAHRDSVSICTESPCVLDPEM